MGVSVGSQERDFGASIKESSEGNIYSTQLHYNPNHRWFYLPEQRENEIFYFKQGDSRAFNKQPYNLAQYGFHTSIRLPDDPGCLSSFKESWGAPGNLRWI